MEKQTSKTLQLDDDMRFHRTEWFLQRLGRICMFLFLGAVICGVFGTGLFSGRTLKNENAEIKYERFLRVQKDALLEIRFLPLSGAASKRTLWLDNRFLKDVKIEHIEPEPSQTKADPDGHSFIFESPVQGAMSVFIEYRLEKAGSRKTLIRIDEKGPEVFIEQFVYP